MKLKNIFVYERHEKHEIKPWFVLFVSFVDKWG